MPRGVKAKPVHKRRQMRSQHGYCLWGSCERGARPKPCSDRYARNATTGCDWNDDQIQLDIAVHRRHPVGLEHQWRDAAVFKPFDRKANAVFCKNRCIGHAR